MADTKVYFSTLKVEGILKAFHAKHDKWKTLQDWGEQEFLLHSGEKLARKNIWKVRGGKVRKNRRKKRDVEN